MKAEFHTQLLALAKRLTEGKPNRAELHRAVSTAYYALFHLLVSEGAKLLQVNAALRSLAGRAFDHGPMKDLCASIKGGKFPKPLDVLVSSPLPSELVTVAAVFWKMQGLRHEADYRPVRQAPFTKSEVQGLVAEVEDAFAKWGMIAGTPAAKAFLLALMMHKKWDR
jgi:hypothetical protein